MRTMVQSVSSQRGHGAFRSAPSLKLKAPAHPVLELQGPFEESMAEAAGWEELEVPSDAASRRTLLLDAPTYERVIAGRWKQKPGEQYHPLWKLVAQLSFGMHLLAENLAKSEDDVMQILQGHIDDIDLFLERTTEDLALAEEDILERLRCLQLPLQHPKVFDKMLEDRTFRKSIVEGNEKIEHIVARTGCAMKDSLKDAQKGLDATSALERYMATLGDSWTREDADHEAVFMAMLENVEGWRQAFINVHTQGDNLGNQLKQLTEVVNQMQQRAGEVSRSLARAQQKLGHNSAVLNNVTYVARNSATSPAGRRSATPEQTSRKPLPGVPARLSATSSARNSSQNNQMPLRPPTNLSNRPDTVQSFRSAASHQSGESHYSRNASREAMRSSVRDSQQSNLNPRAPRIVEIKRTSPRETLQTSPSLQQEASKQNVDRGRPIELPGESSNFQTKGDGLPSINGLREGLGILNGEAQAQSEVRGTSSNATLAGFLSEPNSSSRLSPAPSSFLSSGHTSYTSVHELPSNATVVRPVPPYAKLNQGSPLASPPDTPGWAKQTFELEERSHIVTDKSALRSHPPTAELGSPPLLLSNRTYVQSQHPKFNQSLASSLGDPGPEVATSDRTTSTASGSVNGNNSENSPVKSAQPSTSSSHQSNVTTNQNTKAFTAELEGSTPVTRTPATLKAAVFRHAAVELEAPYTSNKAPSQAQDGSLAASTQSIGSGSERQEPESSGIQTPAELSELSAVETQVAAAVRRSFIATNIELPAMSFEDAPSDIIRIGIQTDEEPKAELPKKGIPTENEQNRDSHGLTVKPLQLSSSTFKPLSTTQTASIGAVIRKPLASSQRSPALLKLSNIVTTPRSSDNTDLSVRSSSASSASSQSQWRAFFKGQLSPAEFSASSPTLTRNPSEMLKVATDAQRRAQMASPTLGWQWNPITPDVEQSEGAQQKA